MISPRKKMCFVHQRSLIFLSALSPLCEQEIEKEKEKVRKHYNRKKRSTTRLARNAISDDALLEADDVVGRSLQVRDDINGILYGRFTSEFRINAPIRVEARAIL